MNQKLRKQKLAILAAGIAAVVAGSSVFGISYAANSNEQYTAGIEPKTAANIAIQYISAQPSNLVKVDLDKESGIYVYSVEIIKGDQEFDVKVDPQTGEVKKVEQELYNPSDPDYESDDDEETFDD
ncbi:MAG: PepSY domain-containing protein [Nitrosarchaeum sp.]